MGSSEFSLWRAAMDEWEIGPDADQQRWASLMAAMHNGKLVRNDKRLYRAADFLPQAPVTKRPSTGASARAFIDRLKRKG
jgi:hypothetical protein